MIINHCAATQTVATTTITHFYLLTMGHYTWAHRILCTVFMCAHHNGRRALASTVHLTKILCSARMFWQSSCASDQDPVQRWNLVTASCAPRRLPVQCLNVLVVFLCTSRTSCAVLECCDRLSVHHTKILCSARMFWQSPCVPHQDPVQCWNVLAVFLCTTPRSCAVLAVSHPVPYQ